ncbi:tRNA dimethylallyltransferase [Desulfurobacterium thermolithotrophum DSM 11699]|uniref:tRNA dimethylallyltransferase n=1 Tax=Desulfurobacterium thermolithotrophum (strain DSM 11699 / BSA) TaxID=868864 RepID=F0S219_DESTD|nr:tRNA (adenosine(37)-N6)-dimethylallyltransferase MiaA [Desulfurobacterium thermolithotrophum]ADY72962.1 tRNA dimethylallyltransferase [Desulfurobacterium thermolithotrophum DSM 11699]
MEREKLLIILTGPTATGKTDFSIKLAKEIEGEIISADSMQVYKGLDIGTDKVSKEIMKEIPHYLIDIRKPNEPFSVAEFVEEADKAIKEIREKNKYPIVVGGTGFYIRALLYGLPKVPAGNEKIRKELEKLSTEEIYALLEEVDKLSAERIGSNDRKRLIRAYEVYKLTGKPLSSFEIPQKPRYKFLGYFLYRNRPELYKRIEDRVDSQIKRGLIDETKWLLEFGKNTTAFQALGYKEMLQYLEGKKTLEEAIKLLKRRTKQFAKRQFTWFRKEPKFKWVNLSEVSERKLIDMIKKEIREEV